VVVDPLAFQVWERTPPLLTNPVSAQVAAIEELASARPFFIYTSFRNYKRHRKDCAHEPSVVEGSAME